MDHDRHMERFPTGIAAAPDLSGTTLGGYRLVRRLGSGGMADVYLAEQKSLGRQVAVKVLRPETTRHPGAVQRFEQEARAAAALVHGNIVQIHEVACIDGVHFLAEEYVGGPSLKVWLAARGPLDPRQALAVLDQVGSALARAAQQGVVHRDIKPDNLLVTPAGEVKVADFGLARVVAEDLELTQTGMTLGTPLYMSPEQCEGRAVDARSDLYSLGATVYHLLTGRPPFTGPTSLSVVMAHLKQPLDPLAVVRPDLPDGLCRIIERLLAKDPAERPAGPTELLHAVEATAPEVGAASRLAPSPLQWEGGVESWAAVADAGGQPPRSTVGVTGRVREATQHLWLAVEREEQSRRLARRVWLATAAAAVAAGVVGFVVGRARGRRSDFWRQAR